MAVLMFLVVLALCAGGVAVVVGTLRRSRWGINLKTPDACPRCGTPIPKGPRKPSDMQEALWGGWTCAACDAKIDKWGGLRET
jgi:hypothetical protein